MIFFALVRSLGVLPRYTETIGDSPEIPQKRGTQRILAELCNYLALRIAKESSLSCLQHTYLAGIL